MAWRAPTGSCVGSGSAASPHGHESEHGHEDDHIHPAPTWFIFKYVFSHDHKIIGIQYGLTALSFLLFGFCLMLCMRWQIEHPGQPIPLIGHLLELERLGARVEVVYLEPSDAELRRRNAGRASPVPARVVDRLSERLERETRLNSRRASHMAARKYGVSRSTEA